MDGLEAEAEREKREYSELEMTLGKLQCTWGFELMTTILDLAATSL